MIFASFGNPPYDFSRLAAALDEIAASLDEEILVQYGHTKFPFKHVTARDFLSGDEMMRHISEASVVVAQGGWGTISECLKMGKRVVAVPRIKGVEHSHSQAEVVRALEAEGCLLAVYDVKELGEAVFKARTFEFEPLRRGDASKVINRFIVRLFRS